MAKVTLGSIFVVDDNKVLLVEPFQHSPLDFPEKEGVERLGLDVLSLETITYFG